MVPGGGVRVSSCAGGGGGQGAGPSLHTPPYTHFIKQVPATNNSTLFLVLIIKKYFQHFAHNIGRRGNPPLLGRDLCLVSWRAGARRGVAVVPVQEQVQK